MNLTQEYIELEWNIDNKTNHELYYTLIYVASFPELEGNLSFIEVHTGQTIIIGSEVTVRVLTKIHAGHEIHHRKII